MTSRNERLAALERGDAAALGVDADALAKARGFLERDDAGGLEQLAEPLLELVLFHAAEHRRAAFLASASDGPKPVAKLAKKELYRLRSEGRPLELPRAPAPEPKVVEDETLPAYVGPIEGAGVRQFLAGKPIRGGVESYIGAFSDELGLLQLQTAQLSRKEYRQTARDISRADAGYPPAMELDAARFGALLADLREPTQKRDRELSAYNQLARAFPGAHADADSRSWPTDDDAARVRDSAKLFGNVELALWRPDDDAQRTLAQRIDEIAVSRVVMDEAQRRTQIEAALDRTTDEHFEKVRRLYAERLFRQADHFAETGRSEPARMAAATARALESDAVPSSIAFCRALFKKALLEQTEAAFARLSAKQRPQAEKPAEPGAEPEKPSGLIIPGR